MGEEIEFFVDVILSKSIIAPRYGGAPTSSSRRT